jgi:hypothetical protein
MVNLPSGLLPMKQNMIVVSLTWLTIHNYALTHPCNNSILTLPLCLASSTAAMAPCFEICMQGVS